MNILVIYYSQSGQLKEILDHFLQAFVAAGDELDFHKIEVQDPFPFPWTSEVFFNEFPETVRQEPRSIVPLAIDEEKVYDLVVLGYQPWFLSPSQPIQAFLKSEQAATILKNKRVITVQGIRNMWIESHKDVMRLLQALAVKPVGNIVLGDRHSNLTSLKTIMKWMFTGDKGPYEKLPQAGVSSKDIEQCSCWGQVCKEYIEEGKEGDLQRALLSQGAVYNNFPIYLVEFNGKRIFRLWSKFVQSKGGRDAQARRGRVKAFKVYLFFMLYVISPIPLYLFKCFHYLFPRYCNRVMKTYLLLE